MINGVLTAAEAGGLEVFLVGGVLRNLAIGARPGRDYDFVLEGGGVKALSEKAARVFGGTSFLLDKETSSYRVVSKARGRRPALVLDFSSIKGGSIIDDLRARDFTVDAIGMDLREISCAVPRVMDPAGGLVDAAERRLRAASPGVFDADPLRVMRALRVSQGYGLGINRETLALMEAKSALLASVSAERVRDELILIFTAPGTPASMEFAYRCGVIEAVLPAAAGWEEVDGYRLKAHAIKTLEEAEAIVEGVRSGAYLARHARLRAYLGSGAGPLSNAALFKLVAFFHDAGKPCTLSRESGRLRFIGHEGKGAAIVKELLAGLRFARRVCSDAARIVGNHHRAFMLAALREPTPRARAHFFRAAGGQTGLMLLLLALADARATRGGEDPEMLALVDRMLSFYYNTYTRKRPRPLLNGREIMETFGVEQGPCVGMIMGWVSKGVEQGVVTNRKEAVEYVRERLASREG
ncbi:MAG: HD domain-containing protein [Thermodesulfobacteriota bacterium]